MHKQTTQIPGPSTHYEALCRLMDIQPVIEQVPLTPFSELQVLAETAKNKRLTAAMQVFINMVAGSESEVKQVDKVLIDNYIALIDETISAQMDCILHNKQFQKLESTWRGLHYLVQRTDCRANIKIHLLDIDKTSLKEDFDDASDIMQSGLYRQVYEKEYDTPGGKPISVMVSDYEFSHQARDINLLNDIAKVAAAAHCPFLGTVGPSFFGKTTMEEVANINDIKDYMSRAEYIRWNGFRDNEDSRYIGLMMPRFLLRLPYGEAHAVKSFSYHESVKDINHEKFLWGAATFAFAANLARSFKDHGWTVGIRGPESGGKVENLTIHHYDAGRGIEAKIPTEIIIPETRELDFSELGFIPLSYYKNSDYACFFSANSVHKPKIYSNLEATANSRINSRMPYVFLAARLGHYLKVLQRENIGGSIDRLGLEHGLNEWLNSLVTKMPNPGAELIARRPLREGKVEVNAIAENPGFYKIDLFATPHFQVEGIDVKLSLVSQLPVNKN